MRRPIFGNGIPRNILNADGVVEVFDAEALDENAVYALTLYLWWFKGGAAPIEEPSLLMRTDPGTGTEFIGAVTAAVLTNIWTAPAATDRLAPLKILDRYMTRGTQNVTLQNSVASASTSCWIWGYFEQVGDQEMSRPFRGLQPTTPQDPFSFAPTQLLVVALEDKTAVLHQLDPNYIDRLTLDLALLGDTAGDAADITASVSLPGGITIPMSSGGSGFPVRMFDGIPMRAPSAADVNISLNGAGAAGLGKAYALCGYGSFDRY